MNIGDRGTALATLQRVKRYRLGGSWTVPSIVDPQLVSKCRLR